MRLSWQQTNFGFQAVASPATTYLLSDMGEGQFSVLALLAGGGGANLGTWDKSTAQQVCQADWDTGKRP